MVKTISVGFLDEANRINIQTLVLTLIFFMINSLPELCYVLNVKEPRIFYFSHNCNKFYHSYIRPKMKYGEPQMNENGQEKMRYLLVPNNHLKLLQSKIADLLSRIALPSYMYGAVKGKNNVMNAKNHLNNKYFLQLDLRDFFSNITNHMVFKMLLERGFPIPIARILTRLTTYKYSLPQGAPSSPVIANLVFSNTAKKLYALSKGENIVFTAFLDDLSFSSLHCFKRMVPDFLHIIRSEGFYPSYKKIHYRTEFSEITGIYVWGNSMKLPYRMWKKAKTNKAIKAYANYVRDLN